ncbi:UvrD-helicase domain-containing protein [Thiomicrorhabdus aquaedulcis]|uniref:UvrD-helicase domain-containing protein n=1 Tax=Thiomicrorhabdus aquaedulcis TaxID=2211106 RepID=UPI00187EB872|nr:UvrD-helicase domain-containing protein [Thiomicrorhabdus aquaedulcis]
MSNEFINNESTLNQVHINPQAAYVQLSHALGLQEDANLPDAAVRFAAINPFDSFIVQAPAGSGKTALLTQRYLALLGQVNQPEQIVAMTFTKKAAAEMRERIMAALRLGLNAAKPNATLFEQNTHALAVCALKRDAQLGWNILQAPHRLRIKTIDGMNGYLVGQMPLLSKMGAQPQVAQNSDLAYLEAVQLTLKSTYCEDAVGQLLRLVNGRFNRAENLLVSMLKKRDQWMGHLVRLRSTDQDEARLHLESALHSIVQSELNEHVAHLSGVQTYLQEACELADYAVQNQQPQLSPLCGAWPLHADLEHLMPWRALAQWLLTSDEKGLRKTVTVKNGFPAGKGLAKEQKDRFLNALAGLNADPHRAQLVESLAVLKNLPQPQYSEEQWDNLQWLVHLLTVAAGYLKVVFQSRGQADFIEIAQAASQALGSALEPTELAEQLDYQIKHILVDEFQDTSAEQNSLMCKLVAGWQPGDGRTLFIVGDPMQSIYRFREAEVGNFLQAWKGRLGEVCLTPVHLTVNFRSTHGVVDWVNRTFVKVFPKRDNIEKGAVSYSPAVAASTDATPAVHEHWALNQAPESEAQAMFALVQQRLAELAAQAKVNPTQKLANIAILGRSRASLMGIARRFKDANIAFKAVELESLAERQEVQDVLALSRALLHLADRPAWIALLRSPLVGLSLADLYALMGDEPAKLHQTVWRLLTANTTPLSDEGQTRLNGVVPILHGALQRLGSVAFSTLVRETWLQLDGAQTVENAVALDNVQVFFDTLAGLDGEALEFSQLDSLLADLYAKADARPEAQQIELMTMHKSKGLEFDTVILPGLGRKPRSNDHQLVSWFAFLDNSALDETPVEQLVIAPIDQKARTRRL